MGHGGVAKHEDSRGRASRTVGCHVGRIERGVEGAIGTPMVSERGREAADPASQLERAPEQFWPRMS